MTLSDAFSPEALRRANREAEDKIRRAIAGEGSGVVVEPRWWFDYVIIALAAALFGVVMAWIWWPL